MIAKQIISDIWKKPYNLYGSIFLSRDAASADKPETDYKCENRCVYIIRFKKKQARAYTNFVFIKSHRVYNIHERTDAWCSRLYIYYIYRCPSNKPKRSRQTYLYSGEIEPRQWRLSRALNSSNQRVKAASDPNYLPAACARIRWIERSSSPISRDSGIGYIYIYTHRIITERERGGRGSKQGKKREVASIALLQKKKKKGGGKTEGGLDNYYRESRRRRPGNLLPQTRNYALSLAIFDSV